MGRHADTSASGRSVQLTPQVLIALAVAAVVLLAGGITVWATNAGDGDCESTAGVRLAFPPAVALVPEQGLAVSQGPGPAGEAGAPAVVRVPAQTVRGPGAVALAAA